MPVDPRTLAAADRFPCWAEEPPVPAEGSLVPGSQFHEEQWIMAAGMLARGNSFLQVSRAMGCSRTTLWRAYYGSKDFRHRVWWERQALNREAELRLSSIRALVAEQIERLVSAGDPATVRWLAERLGLFAGLDLPAAKPQAARPDLASAPETSAGPSAPRPEDPPAVTVPELDDDLEGDFPAAPGGADFSPITLTLTPDMCGQRLDKMIAGLIPQFSRARLSMWIEDGHVTVDGTTYPVPRPFMVLATQNPIEFVGTYPLPEAQLDRFLLRVSMGYPSLRDESEILARFNAGDPRVDLQAVCSAQDVLELQRLTDAVPCAPSVRNYIVQIVAQTRRNEHLSLGASPRGSLYLMRAAQAAAVLQGREYVVPDDIQRLAVPVLAHRLIVRPEARLSGMAADRVVKSILNSVDVPVATE